MIIAPGTNVNSRQSQYFLSEDYTDIHAYIHTDLNLASATSVWPDMK